MIAPDKSLKVGQFTVSGDLFTKGFSTSAGPCSCSTTCCRWGVFVDLLQRDAILAHREIIAREMDDTQNRNATEWFDGETHPDPDFPSGACAGTRVHNDKCAFLDREGRCSIQVASVKNGMHKWALKPLFCVLYPIEISTGIVNFDDMLQDEEHCCSIRAPFEVPVFEACREELVHLVGEEGFNDMLSHYQQLQVTAPSAP